MAAKDDWIAIVSTLTISENYYKTKKRKWLIENVVSFKRKTIHNCQIKTDTHIIILLEAHSDWFLLYHAFFLFHLFHIKGFSGVQGTQFSLFPSLDAFNLKQLQEM